MARSSVNNVAPNECILNSTNSYMTEPMRQPTPEPPVLQPPRTVLVQLPPVTARCCPKPTPPTP